MTSTNAFGRATQALLLIVATIGVVGEALAQQPSQAQVNAIRQSCRNDYMAHCSSVTPGGPAALQCLQQHASSLSATCQQAVSAIKTPTPATAKAKAPAKAPPAKTETAAAPATEPAAKPAPAKATPQSKKAQLASVARACGADYRTHCHGIRPRTAAAVDCLKRNAATLSPTCQHALMGVAAAKSKLASAPATAPAPVKAEPPPLLVSPREEIFLLRMACRRDYLQFCRGLRFGAGRVASCLHYNAANLSPPCQQALAALREGR
jgi:Cysteine rich repeat